MANNNKVLLLNASFEILGVVGLQRAIRLMLREENPVIVEEYTDKHYHSAGGQAFRLPSVIRLKEYVNVRKNIRKSNSKRLSVYTRDKFTCSYCGVRVGKVHPRLKNDKGHPRKMTIGDLTLDHLIPKSRGGKDEPENLVSACKPCNNAKADRTPREANMKLLNPPKSINFGLDYTTKIHLAETHPLWKDYLFQGDGAGDERYAHTE